MEIISNSEDAPRAEEPSRNQEYNIYDDSSCNNRLNNSGNVIAEDALLRVTKITPAMKNERRVNVFVNHKYSFSLDISQLVDLKVKVGQVLTSDKLAECQNASEYGKLYQVALEWALARPHSVKEARDYFKRKQLRRATDANRYQKSQDYLHSEDFLRLDEEHRYNIRKKQPRKPAPPINEQMIEKVIRQLQAKKYLDDQRFAEYYVECRRQKQGTSLKKIRMELMNKGISKDIIETVLAETPRNDSAEIQKIIAKKRRHYPDERKLIQYLLRQGFPYELVKVAVHETDLQSSE